jgi:murein DD-endopeptidase MepM/ murein hydrolase activator NlpD
VSPLRAYKRLETNFIHSVSAWFKTVALAIVGFVRRFFSKGRQKFTIMLIPHSEKSILNFQVSVFAVAFIGIFLLGIIASLIFFTSQFNGSIQLSAQAEAQSRGIQDSLQSQKEAADEMVKGVNSLQTTLSTLFTSLGMGGVSTDAGDSSSSDMASFLDGASGKKGAMKPITTLAEANAYVSSVTQPLGEVGDLIKARNYILSDIPSIWPVKGGIGHISAFYGYNKNPFTGISYLHTGIDISTYRSGDPIVATAAGQVVTVAYDGNGYGNYVIIEHKHGFYTLYGHMKASIVQKGQRVEQGQVIGYIGATGVVTGPHVHYEVRLGSGFADPIRYLTVRRSLASIPDNTGQF